MRIETLLDNVSQPLEIGPTPSFSLSVPELVKAHIKNGRLWHLVAWSDEPSNTFGLARKGTSIVLRKTAILRLRLDFMRPAKGAGFVEFSAIIGEENVPVTLLQAPHFDAEALAWLLVHKSKFESFAGSTTDVNDRGSDY